MIVYSEHYLVAVAFQVAGSVVPKALWYVIPSALITVVLLIWDDYLPKSVASPDTSDITESVVWTLTTAATFSLLGFRLTQAHARFWEGTTLLHQMQGEWFESASCLVAFSAEAKTSKPKEVEAFRQALLRLFSILHASALEEIKKDSQVTYQVIDLGGLDDETLHILYESKVTYGFNRVEVLLHMIQMLMTHYFHEKVLSIAPPILSRVYQTLSRGMVNFINAQKISDTMFPFPFAQLCAISIVFHTLFTPFAITAIIQNKLWAILATVVPVFGICCLNFTAEEIEMPYGDDPNDLPLDHLQAKFNNALLMLMKETSDHVPSVQADAIANWSALHTALKETNQEPSASCCSRWLSPAAANVLTHVEGKGLARSASGLSDDDRTWSRLAKSDTKSLDEHTSARGSIRLSLGR